MIKYYLRTDSRVFVRLKDEVIVEYLNKEFEWVPNQEWSISMFVEKLDNFVEVSEEFVNSYIDNNLTKKMTR